MKRTTNARIGWMNRLVAATAVGALAAAPAAIAGEPDFDVSILVKDGDVIPGGFGTVTNINDISVNNNGDWVVDVSLTGGSTARAILKNGDIWLAQGDPIEPSDTVSSVANLLKALNNNGDITFRPSLTDNGSGVYLNQDLLLLEDQIASAPQFSPGTPYIGFFRSRVTDDGQVLAVVTASDPGLPGSAHRALVWLTIDPDTGDVTEDVVMKRHDHPPGTEKGAEFGQVNSSADTFAINNDGNVLYSAPFTGTPTETNGGLYINDALVARKGDPSPIPGSEYANIGTSSTRVDLSNNGDYIFMTTLTNQPTATNTAIISNNMFTDGPDMLVVQRGDPVPGVPGETIDSLGTGAQPHVDDNGNVHWYARFTGDSDTNQGLFRNNDLVLQKGVTTVDGNLITTVCGTTSLSNGITQSLVASDNGRYVIVRVRFSDGTRAALLVDFGGDCAFADLNCDGSVNVSDLLILLGEWGPCADPDNCPADLNDDDEVNVSDLLILLANWG